MSIKHAGIFIVIILVLIVGGAFALSPANKASNLDGFAHCLKEKGATFYGAFWCPHCQNQKKLFGSAQQYLPYVECSTPDGQNQLQVCIEKNIQSYPTWEFSDGSRETGELSLEGLADKTGCNLPES